jgi:hypothetical protein
MGMRGRGWTYSTEWTGGLVDGAAAAQAGEMARVLGEWGRFVTAREARSRTGEVAMEAAWVDRREALRVGGGMAGCRGGHGGVHFLGE